MKPSYEFKKFWLVFLTVTLMLYIGMLKSDC